MPRAELRSKKPAVGLLIVAPAIMSYAMSNGHVNANLPFIQNDLGITKVAASWLINIEILVCVVIIVLAGRLGERFSSTKIFAIGTFMFGLFNVLFAIPQVQKSYAAIMTLRICGAIGMGLYLPQQLALFVVLISPERFIVAFSTCSVVLPLGAIVSSMLSGIVAKASSWRYMFVGVGAFQLLHWLFVMWKIPFNIPTNPLIKFDYIGTVLLGSGFVLLTFGLIQFEGDSLPMWTGFIFCGVALLLLGLFIWYNNFKSAHPIFAKQVFNRSTILLALQLLILNVVKFQSQYFLPYIQTIVMKIPPQQSGMLIAVGQLGCVFLSPIGNIMQRRATSKRGALILFSAYLMVDVFNGLQVSRFPNIPGFVICNFLEAGLYVGLLVVLQNVNVRAAPQKYSNAIGVLNQLVTNLGHSLGVTIAVVTYGLTSKSYATETEQSIRSSYATNYYVACGFIGIAIVCGCFAGMFQFERGKRGYREVVALQANTFDENLVNDGEMQEVREFTGQQETSKFEQFLSYFGGYTY